MTPTTRRLGILALLVTLRLFTGAAPAIAEATHPAPEPHSELGALEDHPHTN